jgi:hypothetical protein
MPGDFDQVHRECRSQLTAAQPIGVNKGAILRDNILGGLQMCDLHKHDNCTFTNSHLNIFQKVFGPQNSWSPRRPSFSMDGVGEILTFVAMLVPRITKTA